MNLPSMQRLLRQLRKQLKDFPCDPDPRAVHRLRSRIRQVQAFADAGLDCSQKSKRSLDAVRKCAGRLRDLDVFTENIQTLPQDLGAESIARLQRRLRKDHKQSSRSLEKVLARHRKPARRALSEFARQIRHASASSASLQEKDDSGTLAEQARHQVVEFRKEITRWSEPDEENLHSLRKNIKTLRTLLQLMPESDPAEIRILGTAASRIGQWHDWQRLASLAYKSLDDSRDSLLLGQIARTVDIHLEHAIQTAASLRVHYPKPVRPESDTARSMHLARSA
ncbi:MAG TPA: CHAD domain-containing protein [Terracidiphilus sp.]|nr:CHAD domain-containing protein [Terracidiphilus sp.]